jgi:hypothetical protein
MPHHIVDYSVILPTAEHAIQSCGTKQPMAPGKAIRIFMVRRKRGALALYTYRQLMLDM